MATVLKHILVLVLLSASSGVFAADCPNPPCFTRPVTVVVPFAAGGTNDIVARVWAGQLSKQLGQPVIVDNKPGAGGMIGAAAVAKSPPDSQTILLTSQNPISIAPHIYRTPPVNPMKDLVPAAQIAVSPQVLVVLSSAPYKSLKELVSYTSTRPATYGSAGAGTLGHLLGQRLVTSSGAKQLMHASYRGLGPALADLHGGQLNAMITDLANVLGDLKSGKIRAVAISGERRVALVPDVPTFAEQGVQGMESAWYGAFFPAGTDPAIVSRLNTENRKVLAEPEVQTRLRRASLEPGTLDTAAFTRAIGTESAGWAALVKQSNIKVE